MRLGVELAQELDRFEVLAPAESIRHPPARVARVVEVQHRGDRVHPQAVRVILVQPEQRVGDQKVPDLVAAVVEDQRAPLAMLALARVGVLVERRAVEAREPVGVLREVPGHPVEDHADIMLMADVHEGLEI